MARLAFLALFVGCQLNTGSGGQNDVFLDESFAICVSTGPVTMLASAKTHGIAPNYHGGFTYTDAWLES